MEFILAGGNWNSEWPTMEKAVAKADQLGFWGLLLPDHYMSHRKHGGYSTLDSWIALSYLAAKTEKLRLGTFVTPIPFRPPGLLAKMVATIDLLSSGRVVLGVGAGWSKVEFEAFSEWSDPKTLVEKTEEGVRLILRLWQRKRTDFHGKFFKAKGANLEPKPVQKPHPPLLFGGAGLRMLRLAGRYADICYIPPWTDNTYSEAKDIVVKEAQQYSRKERLAFAGGSPSALDPKNGSSQYVKEVEAARDNGCSYFVVAFPGLDKRYFVAMGRFAEDIIPSFT